MSDETTAIMPTPEEARVGCYCEKRRKPCTYHEGYEDGWEAFEQRARSTDLDVPRWWEKAP